jgi:hypothetical protein
MAMAPRIVARGVPPREYRMYGASREMFDHLFNGDRFPFTLS